MEMKITESFKAECVNCRFTKGQREVETFEAISNCEGLVIEPLATDYLNESMTWVFNVCVALKIPIWICFHQAIFKWNPQALPLHGVRV